MRKLLVVLMLVTPAYFLPQVSVSATTEHCPDGWAKKTEVTIETDTVMIRRDGLHCFKYGTETSGMIFTPRGPWSSPNGKGISYFVCYRSQ